jgi:hypothetical protein
MSTVWFCCYCGTGPHNASIIVACTSCSSQHHRCSRCNTETRDPKVECSESGYPQSEYSDIAHVYTIGSRPSYSTLTPTGVQPFAHLPLDTPEYSIPLTAANLASFDAPPTDQGHGPGNSLSTSSRGQVEYCWFCCYCGHGPNSFKHDVNCPNCNNHWRSECCRVEKIVRKK